jgi:hypothetical protein
MPKDPAKQFGQIIGDVLEAAMSPALRRFSRKHKLYLDKKGKRPARQKKVKVTWKDSNDNKHDLDFVLEKGGKIDKLGMPAAFIEAAWRRYTKHSKNKAQEIQGAIIPLRDTYSNNRPFIGAVLAGEFTADSLTQLRSLGFTLLNFSYQQVIDAFQTAGIDARFNEATSDAAFKKKVRAWGNLSTKERVKVSRNLRKSNAESVEGFLAALGDVITRQIKLIRITPLHGNCIECVSVEAAIKAIDEYDENTGGIPLIRYEVSIEYKNSDCIKASFESKVDAIQFLNKFLPILE